MESPPTSTSTAFDGLVFSLMGSLVTLVGILTVLITVRSFFRVDASRTLAWAIRLGLVLMLVSQAVGVQMIAEGGNTFGAAGALKVPHAVALHAAQVLPALALVLLASRAGERHALRVLAVGATGYVGLLASVMAQTYSGRAALDLAVVPAGLALLGFGLLVGSGAVALSDLAASRSPTSPTTLGGPTGPAPLGPGV
ncbi:hypothetical protein KZX45_12475 [Georgenia sp. EYE_87]|uniref:hypothetical protein n=1 Tax=Georgenia sp. EYE_87 TaxID=2853448 RepID=UPI002002BF8A|nr:hypothetical protein [Georgenia sp. EYE_87]MCK6211358.1 hypothetical protein [Georgenia sp. EYE_87]